MRIVVEPSGYRAANLGDWAMLAVALSRVRAAAPDAAVRVHGFDAAPLAALDPDATLLDPYGSIAWSRARSKWGGALLLLAKRKHPRALREFLSAIRGTDLLLVSGAGHLNDVFRDHALAVLETLRLAREAGAVTALTGQGLGPMTDGRLRARAAEVLPHVDVIGLREGVYGPPLLASLGVDPERVVVTGDDAIAVAYRSRPAEPGRHLGVNLRIAPYAGIDDRTFDAIAQVLRRFDHPAQPIPIAIDDDRLAIERLLGRPGAPAPRSLEELLAAIGRCRVVVTGSYHAAVFALAMGIPAVTLAGSEYYVQKFRGLAGQFGAPCHVVPANGREVADRLGDVIGEAWHDAPQGAAQLAARAEAQVAASERMFAGVMRLAQIRRARMAP